MNKEIKKAKMKKFFMIFIPIMLLFMEIATQNVAKDCNYDELLGIGIPVGDIKIYAPWMFFIWKSKFSMVIPTIIMDAQRYIVLGITIASLISMFIIKKMENLTSYGTAKWATKKELRETGLMSQNGVILGINPFSFKGYKDKRLMSKLLRDDGPAHIGVFAPTRSGKGASIIIPTCLEWKKSLVVLDLKGENFNFTASFRKKALKNKIIKFEPFNNDGTSAKWNPIAEIRMGTDKEMSDTMSLARMIADPTGKGAEKGDSHWIDTSTALIQTVILHLLYAHKRQDLPIPTLANVSDFLSSRDMPFDDAIDSMQHFDHISTKEFFEDNPFLKIYGNYIESNFKTFNENLNNNGIFIDIIKLKKIKEELKEESPSLIEKYSSVFRSIREIQVYYMEEYKKGTLNFEDENSPFRCLLTHPKVAAGAAECANRDPKEQGSVTSSANAKFNLYRDPNIINNTAISEFVSTDIMNPNQAVTIYLVIPPNKIDDAIPLIRIFINYALNRNMEEMDFDKDKNKQRCLFLLDEFPQLGRIEKMETAMAIMAGYGLKTLFIAQDINQVNKNYSKDNSIISNCHIRIFFAPNEIETAENICKMLGKQTIEVTNKSQSGAFSTNKSWNQTGRELLTADEVMKMSKDEAIVLVAGFAPIKVKKAWYFKCPYFMDRTQNSKYPNALVKKDDDKTSMKSDTVTIIDNYDSLYKLNGINKFNEDNITINKLKDNIMDNIRDNNTLKDDTPINNLTEVNNTFNESEKDYIADSAINNAINQAVEKNNNESYAEPYDLTSSNGPEKDYIADSAIDNAINQAVEKNSNESYAEPYDLTSSNGSEKDYIADSAINNAINQANEKNNNESYSEAYPLTSSNEFEKDCIADLAIDDAINKANEKNNNESYSETYPFTSSNGSEKDYIDDSVIEKNEINSFKLTEQQENEHNDMKNEKTYGTNNSKNELLLILSKIYSLEEHQAIAVLKEIDNLVMKEKKCKTKEFDTKLVEKSLKANLDKIIKLNDRLTVMVIA